MATRLPVAADKYYPADPSALRAQLDACLARPAPPVAGPHLQPAPGTRRQSLRGLIVPHGSLQDSGMVAAAAYSLLAAGLSSLQSVPHQAPGASPSSSSPSPAADSLGPHTPVLILGTNHFTALPPACLSSAAAWRTPLGAAPLEPELCRQLAAAGLPLDDAPHNLEHSIENQLPFLQHVLGSPGPSPGARPFAIAPVCVGWLGSEAAAGRLARQLAAAVARYEQRRQRQVLLIATSDFTHGGPSYGEAPAAPWMSLREHCVWRDSPLLHAICGGSPRGFLQACDLVGASLCGRWPVAVFMQVAQDLGWSLELLAYAPSDLYVSTGDINGFAAFSAWE
ncbi:hypothetical protein CHLNCDRAFT_135146 [Chlorella variabilis]|uniref:Extradiol ring-cleavage dioxygenase class III enzyme subunit B domain-containing protein n=1 Tax=Chlorella variabilis TaxID=554065 RepID=E1ZHK7_CHLVA|nr:hypothetical protein CHLNCDRAFT_135146 [Chlorella variabilis]EFN54619.1 hypothetical protein CHLNCDRAFT_135146 [Chlorella variabilis]|eukprot:XP_005846721.1 hypothetical protein CHLNCDRAFT_135146 [Chlorella variabilis]